MSYIIKTIILTAIFVAVIYFFMFRRRKIRRQNMDFDSVREYHETYLADKQTGTKNTGTRTNFVTRYNSTEDYREK